MLIVKTNFQEINSQKALLVSVQEFVVEEHLKAIFVRKKALQHRVINKNFQQYTHKHKSQLQGGS